MTDKWAVNVVKALYENKSVKNNFNGNYTSGDNYELMVDKVVSANPFYIELMGRSLKIYISILPLPFWQVMAAIKCQKLLQISRSTAYSKNKEKAPSQEEIQIKKLSIGSITRSLPLVYAE